MSTVRLLRGPTIAEVTDYLLDQLPAPHAQPPGTSVAEPAVGDATLASLLGDLGELTDDDIDGLLDELAGDEGSGS